jgi:hypothetical protein
LTSLAVLAVAGAVLGVLYNSSADDKSAAVGDVSPELAATTANAGDDIAQGQPVAGGMGMNME